MNYTDEQMDEIAALENPREKLRRIEQLSDERIANVLLFPHMRDRSRTFTDVLCYLIGMGAFSTADLDVAIGMVRSADERLIKHRLVY